MQRLARILFVNGLACWLVLGLAFVGIVAALSPAVALTADPGAWRVLDKHGSVRVRAPDET